MTVYIHPLRFDAERHRFSGLHRLARAAAVLACAAAWPTLPSADTSVAALPSPHAQAVLAAVNDYRRGHGLVPLQRSAALEHIATAHSGEMAAQRRASHAGFTARFGRAGSELCVENVAAGYAAADAAVDGWRASPPHDHNLLEPRLRWVGVASVDRYTTWFACDTAGLSPLR